MLFLFLLVPLYLPPACRRDNGPASLCHHRIYAKANDTA
jgi:hypothetical protein